MFVVNHRVRVWCDLNTAD